MRLLIKTLLFFLPVLFSINSMNAQGTRCADIEPFCAGDERLTFPNANFQNSNQITGEFGPDYGCLDDQPFPAWFFLQIEDSGDLSFRISQYENENGSGAPLDVDFVVWGPFERGADYCSGSSLNEEKIVDCSYLPDAIEFMSIPNAQANEIYVVVITNFEQVPGFISLEQTNSGEGSTDCSILDLNLGGIISVCDEDEYLLDGTTDEDAEYEWFVFNENTSQYESISGANGPTYTVTESGDYRLIATDPIENKSEQDDVTVTFYDSPVIGDVDELPVCVENIETIDLNEASFELIEPNAGGSNYEVLYYESLADVENANPISNTQTYPFENGKTIYAQVEDQLSGCVSGTDSFTLSTFDFPDYELSENTIFCVDLEGNVISSVNLGEALGDGYDYEWYDGNELIGNSAIQTFQDFPENDITVRISHADSGCQLDFTTVPVMVSRPETISVEISGSDFGDGYTVTGIPENVIGAEFAEFEFRIDNGNWQASPDFTEVPPGSHVLTAREINGCGETTSESFFLVGYPRFFSPNGDNFNDNWNLVTDNYITIKKLYIFDRYGKLIIELNPNQSKGWDGTYNGNPLPSDDYWFRVEFIDEKTGEHRQYMSNFTLMR
ncbi:T9SS type B sorting domain-containing protein [Christiangramia sp. SM2212]|uniref:T9SS type B sorting domain-containing protein n=1 Tax=Christiangramia sediminicola TaxID=3073267 RepID=A0ABU1EUY9_9FLAO|nr:T9SS type B sorting domain-containing protein [Christiangramia sp. SM2212]MDR5591842.1 T9SS type B sorting domain-containing protein [Christiangramia sp. SM2212]